MLDFFLYRILSVPLRSRSGSEWRYNMKKMILALLSGLILSLYCCPPVLADEGVLNLPPDLTAIEAEAFAGLESVLQINLPETVTEIGAGAFRDCGSPSDPVRCYFPPAGIAAGEGAFEGCRADLRIGGRPLPYLEYTVREDSVTVDRIVAAADQRPAQVTIPDRIDGKPVTAIGTNVFSGWTGLTGVILPSSLTDIGAGAFRDCSALNEVQFPEGLVTIGSEAFSGCTTLNQIAIPSSVRHIGDRAFRYCQALTEVTLPEGVTLGTEIFGRCIALTTAVLPDSLTEIPNYTFFACTRLANVTFPAGLTGIGREAFADAFRQQPGIAVYELPDTLAVLGNGAFNGCGAALCVAREGTVEALLRDNNLTFPRRGETDFRYRYETASVDGETVHTLTLTGYAGSGGEVIIPDGPAVIAERAFLGKALTAVTVPEGVTTIRSWAFENCAALENVHLPDTLTAILNGAFKSDAKLTAVNFPAGLTVLKSDAFNGTCRSAAGTVYFELPENLTECDGYVFNNCGAVLSVVRNSATEALIRQNQNYIFAYRDSHDFAYRMSGQTRRLYRYLGSSSPVILPDDCEAVYYDNFRNLVDGGLICSPLSATDAALSAAGLNHTFPGHEDVRYRVIDGKLYIMGWAGSGTSIVIPKADAYIGAGWDEQVRAGAFQDNETVTKVVLPEGVTRVNANAFTNCYNLADITFPSSLLSLDQNVFIRCGQNAADPFFLTLPDGMTDLGGRGGGANTFSYCNAVLVCGKTSDTAALLTDRNFVYTCPGETDFRYRYVKGEDGVRRVWLVGYEGTSAEANIPSGIYGVRRFDANTTDSQWRTFHGYAFHNNTTVTKVVLPEGTVVIEDSAFLGCVNLTDITFPSSLTTLKSHAFERCGSAASDAYYYFLPDNITEIYGGVGAGWDSFNGVRKGALVCGLDSVTARTLSDVDHTYCFALREHHKDGLLYRYEKSAVNGSTVYRLHVYEYIGSAEEVIIPDDIGLYGVGRVPLGGSEAQHPAFNDDDIRKLVIPEGVRVIEQYAVYNCRLLTDITLPDSLTRIGSRAFEGIGTASSVTRFIVVIPAGVTDYDGNYAWAPFRESSATLVALGTTVQEALYDHLWQFYKNRASAEAGIGIVRQPQDGVEDPTWHGAP